MWKAFWKGISDALFEEDEFFIPTSFAKQYTPEEIEEILACC